MIVVVEGIDRVGKTTFCRMLEANGFFYLKDNWLLKDEIRPSRIPSYSIGKLDTMISVLNYMNDSGMDVVVDRMHITEWVYGKFTRKYIPSSIELNNIDRALAKLNAMLVLVVPENLQNSSEEHGSDLKEHCKEFYRIASASAISIKMTTSYSEFKETVNEILKSKFAYDLYLASPFFTKEHVEREEFVKDSLRSQGLNVFSPKENCHLHSDADLKEQKIVFQQNCDAIKSCRAVFAITDGKDIGTIWEAGYAYGIGIPVIYYAETLGDKGFNLMLAQSGKIVIQNRDAIDVNIIMNALSSNKKVPYRGEIE